MNNEEFGMLYGNHVRDLIRRRTGLTLFIRDYLWTSGKGVLYRHSERSGFLYGNHIYTVIP